MFSCKSSTGNLFVGEVTFLILILSSGFVRTFNLEYRIPVVKTGERGSYFGYSVAEHKINPTSTRADNNLLLVGAPLGQNLQPYTNRSGALYKCKISTDPNDCEQVVTDGRRSDDEEPNVPLERPLQDETKNGQWLGAVVRSQGELVLVCGHRYMKNYWADGLCYILTNELKFESAMSPCNGRPKSRAHEEFGSCQAGTSGMFVDDGTVVLGSPGPYTWRGSVFVSSMGGEYLGRDKTVYHGPFNNGDKPVDKYSYLGMSVAAGKFFDNETAYAAGGPRSSNTGQVVIFKKIYKKQELIPTLTLNGEQFASSFGYEMATADLNGDRLTDLIVGAPFYFNKQDGGAVYIYINNAQSCNLTCREPIKLTGKLESRFGFAITNLGDLNRDGFEDIAIGAPYEGYGVVYIYLGSYSGIITEPSQRITAEDLPGLPIKTLGYSLSGGLDMDNNGYPDLLVGAYEDDTVVLFRARPIIDLKTKMKPITKMTNIDPSIPGCTVDPTANHTCFAFYTCCTITSKIASSSRSQYLNLKYTLEAETFNSARKISRVWFSQPDKSQRHKVIKRMIVTDVNKEQCDRHLVYIKENVRDILSPIKFHLNFTLEQGIPKYPSVSEPLPPVDNYPILNQQEAEKIFNATFQKDCGDDDMCVSDLSVDPSLSLKRELDHYILTLGKEDEMILNINVANDGEAAYEAQLVVMHPKGLTYVNVGNDTDKQLLCNKFNDTIVSCRLGNPFKNKKRAFVQLRFDPKTLSNSKNDFKFIVFANSTSAEKIEKDPSEIKVIVVKNAEVFIKGSTSRINVLYGGKVKGESDIKFGDDIGSNVTHIYQVVNKGPWKVQGLQIEVSWPYQVANNKAEGKWLLYLEKPPIIDATNGGECFLSNDQVNPLNISSTTVIPAEKMQMQPSELRRRTKRDTEMVVPSHTILDDYGRKRQVVTMDCKENTAKCITFRCTVYSLPKHGTVTLQIRARLWNSTLVEDYPNVDWVEIISRASIIIPPEYGIQQDTSDDEDLVRTLALPDFVQQQTEPPWWIIIVAIVVGLVVLILLTLLLWKLGFFKRRRPDPTLSANILKKNHEESPFLSDH